MAALASSGWHSSAAAVGRTRTRSSWTARTATGTTHGGRYRGGREPFLGRWLFSPRLLIVVVIIALGLGLGLGGWWLTSGRFTQVPSVSGDSVTQATAVLTADGFTVKQGARVHSNTVPSGSVAGTSPAGRVSKGSTITILVSDGPFTSVVPQVQNETLTAAQAALQRVHLVSTTEKVGSNAPVGTVIGTSPPAGTTWPQTKTVTILVAGRPPLPNFAGMTVPDGPAVGESARREPAAAAGHQQPATPGHHHWPAARAPARCSSRARP